MAKYKCAIYTRVSTEEQAENPEGSIRNQELRLREFVKLKNLMSPFGEVVQVFSDPGISAKDMNRPGFQKMLRAIEKREVNIVLVTELSRFTRSMKDFSLLQEFLKKHDCEFLSLRENFDSSTAAGNMVMTIMATLAEFERKQTGERTATAFLERAKRGLYNGGAVPIGYEVDANKPGSLVVVEEEAAIVRGVFETFLKEETLAATAKRLNLDAVPIPRKVRSCGGVRGKIWHVDLVYRVLKQKSYIGVRVFRGKKGGEWHEVEANWPGIVGREMFERVGTLLKKNRSRKRTHAGKRFPYTLSGVLFCRTCGQRLCGKSAHGRAGKIAYYEHAWALRQVANQASPVKICDSHHRILAARIEPVIWRDLKEVLLDDRLAVELLAVAAKARPALGKNDRLGKLTTARERSTAQVEVLVERVAGLPKDVDAAPFYTQVARLQAEGERLGKEIEKARSEAVEEDRYLDLSSLRAFTAALKLQLEKADTNPDLQAAIFRKVVHRIDVLPDGYEIFYHAGLHHFQQEFGAHAPGSSFFCAQNRPGGTKKEAPFSVPRDSKVQGSCMLTNGEPRASLSERLYPIDTKDFSGIKQRRISPEMIALYRKGWSLRDIAREYGFSKNKVNADLRRAGVILRENITEATPHRKSGGKQAALPYFGFCYFEGKIAPDTREFPTLKLIHRMWKNRKTIHQITLELNRTKIPSRKGREWSWAAVQNIVKRFEQKTVVLHPGGRYEFR